MDKKDIHPKATSKPATKAASKPAAKKAVSAKPTPAPSVASGARKQKAASGVPEILQSGHPVLHKEAEDVVISEIKTPKIQNVIRSMIASLESQADGVGLAAPQIGIPLKIFVVAGFVFDRMKKTVGSPHEVFINPVITKESKEKKWMDGEGCLSVRWLYGKVYRSTRVTLEAYNEKGEKKSRGSSGLLAHIFQHEVDHLHGILFTDKAKDLQEFDPEEIKADIANRKHGHHNTPEFNAVAAPEQFDLSASNDPSDEYNPEL